MANYQLLTHLIRALDTTDTKDLEFVVYQDMLWKDMVLHCLSKLLVSGNISTGGGGGRVLTEALFIRGGSAEKNTQPNCGSKLFCSSKISQLSKVSQQFCGRLLILQNKWYQKNVQDSF